MKSLQLGGRYAKALYQLASEQNQQDQVFTQIRTIAEAIHSDPAIIEFLSSPMIRPTEKEKAFEGAFKSVTVSDLVKNFVFLLARKQRLDVFDDIVTVYQTLSDQKHGMVRGTVRSTTVLTPEERKRIEETVNRVTKKQSLLTYKEDPHLLGGMVAEVGSYTFDDSLASHLRRMNEQLTTDQRA
jgi:F-type H+-transporting ATPase subunit delta